MEKTQKNQTSTVTVKRSIPQHPELTRMDEPFAWANEHVDISSSERLTQRPWATTWRLTTPQGNVWLKQLSPVLSRSINTSVHLAREFPNTIPEVIAVDIERGLQLSSDHGGKALDRSAEERHRTCLLGAYAHIQAHSVDNHALHKNLPHLRIDALVDDLIAFLDHKIAAIALDGAQVSGRYFMSRGRCRRYVQLLRERAPMLKNYLQLAADLPATINHGDLRTSNAARTASGESRLFDWDEAVAGPAGLSLHGMFSGSLTVMEVLHETNWFNHPEKLRQPRRELDSYMQSLAQTGYADRPTLAASLGASTVAGMLHYIVGFSRFPHDSSSYQRTVRRNLKKRISNLLDVCDWLCLRYGGNVISQARSYAETDSNWRAERLLELHLELHPMHAPAWAQLGTLLRERGRLSRSVRALERSLSIDPGQPEAMADLGVALARRGQYIPALKHLTESLTKNDSESNRVYRDRVTELYRLSREADKPGTVPAVTFTAEETASGSFTAESLTLCEALFRKHGVLLMKEVFDPALLTRCHDTFVERYQSYLSDVRHKDALRIGDKRFQITLDMEPPYNSPELYGNGLIVPLMRRLVGQECILGCFVSVMSLPGSENQRLHKDHKDLFHDDPDGKTVPSFAVTVMVPLVDLDEQVGTTRIVKGSHRLTTRESRNLPMQTPIVKLGDCYLMDYRVSHHGQANRSNTPRPIVSMLYQRPWFRDYMNFRKQPPMRLEREAYDAIPESLQPLFRWTTEPR